MDKKIYLLSKEGNFYKANLHSHTTFSDGTLTPEQSKEVYQKQGYSIIAFTDHRIYKNHKYLNDDKFLAIAGYEIDINEQGKDWPITKTYHINLYDTNPTENIEQKEKTPLPEQEYYNFEKLNKYIKDMKDLGFIACYNHPFWSLQNYDDMKNLKGLWGMEIYNHGCEHDGLYGYNPQSYDEMLRLNNKIYCVATDDNHNVEPFDSPLCDSFGGFTMIKANSLTYKDIINSLLNGNFYSSIGPEIKELYIENNTLYIKTSPVEKIFVITAGRHCYKKLAKKGETITEAYFELSGNEGFIRLSIKDNKGLYASSNGYFLDDLK